MINDSPFKKIESRLKEIKRKAPRAVGAIAVRFFEQNFNRQGFLNGGVQAWDKRKDGSDPGRGVLIGRGSAHLAKSIRVIRADQQAVTVGTNVPYAKAHNDGAQFIGRINITEASRKYFWAMYYQTGNSKYKAMALTKKTEFNPRINIPKRQFIGNSKELNQEIGDWFQKQISESINQK